MCSVSYESLNSAASPLQKSIAAISAPFVMASHLLSQLADFGASKATPCTHWIHSIAENPKPSELEPKGVQRSTSEGAKLHSPIRGRSEARGSDRDPSIPDLMVRRGTSSDPTVATRREATRQVNSWKACSPHDGTRSAAQPLRVDGSGYSCVGSSCSASAAGWSRTSCQSPGWLIAASVVTAQPASIVKPRDIATVRAKWITPCPGGIG